MSITDFIFSEFAFCKEKMINWKILWTNLVGYFYA